MFCAVSQRMSLYLGSLHKLHSKYFIILFFSRELNSNVHNHLLLFLVKEILYICFL